MKPKKILDRLKRARKSKAKLLVSSPDKHRLIVYRSSCHIYAQLIEPATGNIIAASSDMKVKKGNKVEKAEQVGKDIAKAAQEKKITEVCFDRNGFKYHGRVKAVAEGARGEGLKF
ncbi:50S ribosomal protein L18 [Patescibacteria group bacterium]|nr:50S ribosomal protein L18 [Patescibacteria group bacterium]